MAIVHILASTETASSGGTRRVAGLEFTTEAPRFVRDPPAAILEDPFLVHRPSSEAEAKEAGAEIVAPETAEPAPLRLGRSRAALGLPSARRANAEDGQMGLAALGAVLGRIADALEARAETAPGPKTSRARGAKR
ncbi:MAG: hypothetical protein AAGC60_30690 [Acidobacteriota bacterium]